jgi:pimeloyl-ACP methyl ester carboxylesterase
VLLLVNGLGMQLISWPPALIQALCGAGYRVICFDNRDAGLSQRFPELGLPHLPWAWLRQSIGLPGRPPYTLQDMAEDALSLLDALGIGQAHVLGLDLGGMIAQRMALSAPQRLRSLCSAMSSSGARHLLGPIRALRGALLQRPRQADTASLLAQQRAWFERLRSPPSRTTRRRCANTCWPPSTAPITPKAWRASSPPCWPTTAGPGCCAA